MNEEKLLHTIEMILTLLTESKFVELAELCNGEYIQAEHIEKAVSDYPYKLIYPKSEIINLLDIIEVDNSTPREWSVYCDLWTEEEGKSDLNLQLSIIEDPSEFYKFEIDGIHVL